MSGPLRLVTKDPAMKLSLAAGVSLLAFSASGQIGLMGDATGMPLVSRLMDGSGLPMSAVPAIRVHHVGQVANGSQGGLLTGMTLRGAEGTSISMGSGIVLTSGLVNGLPGTNTQGWYSNVTNSGGNNYFRDFPAQTGTSRHGGRLDEHDENSITFDIDVPDGVQGLSAEFVYASDEFPEFAGTQYADGFAFFVNDINYAKLPDGRPVSLLTQGENIHFMTNGDYSDASVPQVADVEYDGLTRVLQLTAPLLAGHRNTITIVVADTGDEIYDSAVFLSSLRFIFGETPINPEDCSVKIRHSSEDDAFVEFGEVQCEGDLVVDHLVDDSDFASFAVAYEALIVPLADVKADFNVDGYVDDADFVIFAAAYDRLVCP